MAYTTIEQSKKLLELGLDPSTADMWYHKYYDADITGEYYDSEYPDFERENNLDTPCWSLDKLIDLMPYEITEDHDTYRLMITHKLVQYPRLTTLWPSLYNSRGDSTFEATYKMMIWLLENNYINLKQNEHD